MYDGIEYKYQVSPNEENIPRITLLYSQESDKENQSFIWLYLKESEKPYSWKYSISEQEKFLEGIKRKTSYFDNLVYDIDPSLQQLEGKIYKGKGYTYSPENSLGELHILIGQVPYKLDWNILGIDKINVPIAIEVPPTVQPLPTREDVKYTTESIEAIKKAIVDVSTTIVSELNKKRVDINNVWEWLEYKRQYCPTLIIDKERGLKIDLVSNFTKHSLVALEKCIFVPFKNLTSANNIDRHNVFHFTCQTMINKGTKSTTKYDFRIDEKDVVYKVEGRLNKKKLDYLCTLHPNDVVKLVKWTNLDEKEYGHILTTNSPDQIKIYTDFSKSLWNSFKSFDDIVVPKEIVEKIKKEKPTIAGITIHKFRPSERASDFTAVPEAEYVTFEQLNKIKGLLIYGTQEDRRTLDNWYRSCRGIKFAIIANSNQKHIEGIHNFINVKDIKETKEFKRVVTAYYIHKLLEDNKWTERNTIYPFLRRSYPNVDKCVNLLKEYRTKNLKEWTWRHELPTTFLDSCLAMAMEENLFDWSILPLMIRTEEALNYLSFLDYFAPGGTKWHDSMIEYISKCKPMTTYRINKLNQFNKKK